MLHFQTAKKDLVPLNNVHQTRRIQSLWLNSSVGVHWHHNTRPARRFLRLRSFQHEICGVDGFFDELGGESERGASSTSRCLSVIVKGWNSTSFNHAHTDQRLTTVLLACSARFCCRGAAVCTFWPGVMPISMHAEGDGQWGPWIWESAWGSDGSERFFVACWT